MDNARILVVDDSEFALAALAQQLQSLAYTVHAVSSAQAALDAVRDETFTLIISDLQMPDMSGTELCRHLRQLENCRHVHFILVTGTTDADVLAAAIEAGVDDVLHKPVNLQALRLRLQVSHRVVSLSKEVHRHNRLLRDANRELTAANRELTEACQTVENDLQAAAEVQRSLLPAPARFHTVSVEWLLAPSHFLAGDTLDYYQLDEKHVGFYLLDVAGHGTMAALQSFTVNKMLSQTTVRNALLKTALSEPPYYRLAPPHAVIAELNRRFCEARNSEQQYFTMLFGLINIRNGELAFSQAGHPPPLLYSAATGQTEYLGDGGLPVGLFTHADYDTRRVQLQPGDRLYLYSDGVTECRAPDGEGFGPERLAATLRGSGARPLADALDGLSRALGDWHGSERFDDDVTTVAIEWRP